MSLSSLRQGLPGFMYLCIIPCANTRKCSGLVLMLLNRRKKKVLYNMLLQSVIKNVSFLKSFVK